MRTAVAKLNGYFRRLRFEWNKWQWKRDYKRCREAFLRWREEFQGSNAEVLVGAHLHFHGGVRNHLLAIREFSKHRTLLVPTEYDLQRFGGRPLTGNYHDFLATQPPASLFAVHTHVLPLLIDWAEKHRSIGLRWIHTHHLLYYPSPGSQRVEPWQEELNQAMVRAGRLCDTCLCVSRWETEYLKNNLGISAFYLPNGVDVRRCDEARAERFRKRYRLSGPFVLWVGRLDPVKNPEAFVKLSHVFPKMNFVMIGGVTEAAVSGEYSLKVPPNLKLLPQLPHLSVLDAIAACDAIVVTSFREGLPTLVLEAMALRRQIVIPDEPGCMDATDGGENALVYRQGDVGHLSQQLESVIRSPQYREKARKRVLAEFDWRVVAAKLDQVYKTGEVP
jgi:glycosyltransferase involved in cell wall biosynthesis